MKILQTAGCLLLILLAGAGHALSQELVISEFLASNSDGLRDEAGNAEDWIELHNPGDTPVSLQGWRLTDDPGEPAKWVFPVRTLPAGGCLLVWASGRDRRDSGEPLHTNFKLSAAGEYLGLIRPDGSVADRLAPAFPPQAPDISSGRERSVGGPVFFSTPTPGEINGAGSLPGPAIRNVTRNPLAPIPGQDRLVADSVAEFSGIQGQGGWRYGRHEGGGAYTSGAFVEFAGGQAADGGQAPQQWTGSGWAWSAANALARTLQSGSDATPGPERHPVRRWVSDVSGEHTLTGSFQNLRGTSDGVTARIYHNGALLYESDVMSTTRSFSLTVTLKPDDTIDVMTTSGTSGEDRDDETAVILRIWKGNAASWNVRVPVTASITPVLSPVASVMLKYRTQFGVEQTQGMRDDGTAGDHLAGDGVYTAVIETTAAPGQMIRWRVEAADTSGNISQDPPYADPLDSARYHGVVAEDPLLLDSRLPVLHWFVENAAAAGTETGTRGCFYFRGRFYDNIRTTLHGQSSAGFSKKSYNVDFNRDARFVWKDEWRAVKDINLISNWGDKAKVRHPLAYEWCARAGDPALFGETVRVQQNGAFYSTADLVEEGDDRFLERAGLDPEAALYKIYDRLEKESTAKKQTRKDEGTEDLAALISGLGQSGTAKLTYGFDHIDLPGTVNYLVTMDLINNRDQGHKNFYMVRDTNGTGEWRPLAWDNDLSWGRNYSSTAGYLNDPFTGNSVPGGQTNRLKSLIFDNAALNAMYWRRLRTVMDELLQPAGTASPRVEARLEEMVNLIDPPGVVSDAELDYARWGSWGDMLSIRPAAERIRNEHLPTRRAQIYGLASLPPASPAFQAVTLTMGEYNPPRGQQEEYLRLSHALDVAVDLSGWRLEGGIQMTFRPGTVLPPGLPLHVVKDPAGFRARSVPPKGAEERFVVGGYAGQLSARGGIIRLVNPSGAVAGMLSWAGAATPAQQFLRVTEVMYHPAPPTPSELAARPWATASDFEFIELQNTGSAPLFLGSASLSGGVDFVFPEGFTLAPGAFAVLVNDEEAFALRYGDGVTVAGVFSGNLSNSGELLRLLDPAGETVLEFAWETAWQPATAGGGRALAVAGTAADWSAWGEASQWRAGTVNGGSPGRADPEDYSGWRAAVFPGEAAASEEISGPGADPDKDGAANLLEYALATNPLSALSFGGLTPQLMRKEDGGLQPVLVLTSREETPGLSLVVESSQDLAVWSSAVLTEISRTREGNHTMTRTLTGMLPAGDRPVHYRLRAVFLIP